MVNKDEGHKSSEHKKPSLAVSFIAAFATGAIEATMMYPFEFIKTQLQLQDKKNPKYSSPLSCAKMIIQEHGPLGLYRGLPVLFLGSIGKAATRFTIYEYVKSQIMRNPKETTFSHYIMYSMIAGGIGGVGEALISVTPMETIKTKIMHDAVAPLDKRKYRGLVHGTSITSFQPHLAGISTIIREEGLRGIYKAPFATVLKQSTNQMVRFGVFDSIRYKVTGNPTGHLNFFQNLAAGALAGATSVIVNNPFDVVKSQMQGLDAHKYSGFFDCMKKIWTQRGPAYFYRGVSPRMIRVCGDAAITFTAYNELCQIIQKALDG